MLSEATYGSVILQCHLHDFTCWFRIELFICRSISIYLQLELEVAPAPAPSGSSSLCILVYHDNFYLFNRNIHTILELMFMFCHVHAMGLYMFNLNSRACPLCHCCGVSGHDHWWTGWLGGSGQRCDHHKIDKPGFHTAPRRLGAWWKFLFIYLKCRHSVEFLPVCQRSLIGIVIAGGICQWLSHHHTTTWFSTYRLGIELELL